MKNFHIVYLFFLVFGCIGLNAQSILIQNLSGRNTFSLNGKWHYIMDPYETGYYDFRYKAYDADERRKKNPDLKHV